MKLYDYDETIDWLNDAPAKSGPHLLLGNGFSMAYSAEQFSYKALKVKAEENGEIGEIARELFASSETSDFERVIKEIEATATVLKAVKKHGNEELISDLDDEAKTLKEALARAIVELHPDVHYEIDEAAAARVGEFLDQYKKVYTTNYDILLYWVLMKNLDFDDESKFRRDDGFREARPRDPYVVWDNLNSSRNQTVYYLHGALHLFLDESRGELQKITWIRTSELLLEQIRDRLSENSLPLIITEGTSAAKRSKIMQSDYLGTTLRSFANIGGGLLVYGLAFSENDNHLTDAILNSSVSHLAVSLFGDPESENNIEIRAAVEKLITRRKAQVEANKRRTPLTVRYFDSSSVSLW